MNSRATLILHDELEIFLILRELFSRNRIAESFDNETLAELLYRERYTPRRVDASEVEAAREAFLTDDKFLA